MSVTILDGVPGVIGAGSTASITVEFRVNGVLLPGFTVTFVDGSPSTQTALTAALPIALGDRLRMFVRTVGPFLQNPINIAATVGVVS